MAKLALFFNTLGSNNTAVGQSALLQNTIGDNNTAIGVNALQSNTEGTRNTSIGVGSLLRSTGNDNIAVGAGAGTFLTAGDNNIYVGNKAVATEDNTIRLGDEKVHTAAFIAGISGVDQGSPTAVFINTTTGQLGTTPPASSRRFKKEIKPMSQTSEAILALKPVTFHYRSDKTNRPEFGLIAEEVAAVNPDLVIRDKNGEIYTVRYDAVNVMFLNEFLKEHRTVQQQTSKLKDQDGTISRLKALIREQEKLAVQQQKQIEGLTIGLRKVSDRVELINSSPRLVAGNH
jgi:Chaperone of endosialidase